MCLSDFEADQTQTIVHIPCEHFYHERCVMRSVYGGNDWCLTYHAMLPDTVLDQAGAEYSRHRYSRVLMM